MLYLANPITRGPDKNLPKMLAWQREINHQAVLWDGW